MRSTSLTFTLLLMILSGILRGLLAQQPYIEKDFKNYRPVTPTAFQFLKYTEMPVSEYTGIPGISIPLYEIKEDGVSVPLTLNYHAGGIRVSQDASWIGLGWDMTFGSIVQIVNDNDDLGTNIYGNPYKKVLPDPLGGVLPVKLPQRWVYHAKNLAAPPSCGLDMFDGSGRTGWESPWPINPPSNDHKYAIVFDGYVPIKGEYSVRQIDFFENHEHYFDSEPDIFQANFLGHSLNFILDWGVTNPTLSTAIVMGQRHSYKIIAIANGGCKIIAPTGDEFYFEIVSTVKSIYTFTGPEPIDSKTKTSTRIWLLTKIVTTKKKEIIFNYTKTSPVKCFPNYSESFRQSIRTGVSTMGKMGESEGYMASTWPYENTPTTGNLFTSTSIATENRYYPQSIVFPKGRVNFITSATPDVAGGQRLDSIAIVSAHDSVLPVLSYKMSYGMFDTLTAKGNRYTANISVGSTSLRLKLLSVTQQDGGIYSFRYNSTPLPDKNSFAQDLWGYYNGATSNTSLIPNPLRFKQRTADWSYDNRNNNSANILYAKAGILEEIKYPTQGKTVLEYELNQFDNYWVPDYSQVSNTISSGNGLRVKNIYYYSEDAIKAKTERYTYKGGKAITPMQLFRQYNATIIVTSFSPNECRSYLINEVSQAGFFSSNPLSSTKGVGYDTVTREEVALDGSTKGKTVSLFQNIPDKITHSAQNFSQTNITLPAVKDNINNPENGSVKQVLYYDKNNFLQKKVENKYRNFLSNLYYGARVFNYSWKYYFCGGDHGFNSISQHMIGYYPIINRITKPDVSKTTLFSSSQADSMVVEKVYSYNEYYVLLRSVYERSIIPGQSVQFPYLSTSYLYPDSYSASTVYNEMINRNMIGIPVHIEKSSDNHSPTEKTLTQYQILNDRILPATTSITKRWHPYNVKSQLVTYDSFDDAGNLLQFTSQNQPTSLVWGYGNNYVIAEATNAKSNQVFYTSFEDVDGTRNVQSKTGEKIRTSNYTKSLTGLTNGQYRLEYWKKNNSAWQLQVADITVSIASYTINIAASEINPIDEVRFYPHGSLMKSYTYKPLIGINSETDASNRTIRYEYDGAGRLYLIRDENGNILKQFCYNYAGQEENCLPNVYYSVPITKYFYKQNCSAGMVPIGLKYSVPAKWKASFVSQEFADRLAMEAFNMEGQNKANAEGACTDQIYVKLSYENLTQYDVDVLNGFGGYRADIVFSFFADQACTQPVSVTNLNVKYTVSHNCNDELVPVPDPSGAEIIANGHSIIARYDAIVSSYKNTNCQSVYVPPHENDPGGWREICSVVPCDFSYCVLPDPAYHITSICDTESEEPPVSSNIYAKISYENIANIPDGITADVVLRFYSDEACTTPASVSDLSLSYNIETNCNQTLVSNIEAVYPEPNPNPANWVVDGTQSITVSGSSCILSSYTMVHHEYYGQLGGGPDYMVPLTKCDVVFELQNGNGYIVK